MMLLSEGRVMQFTQGDAVGNNWFTPRLAVRDDMRRVQQFLVAKTAQRAGPMIGGENAFTKTGLVETLLDDVKGIRPLRFFFEGEVGKPRRVPGFNAT